MTIIKAGLNELDLVAGLFDQHRVFCKQASAFLEGRAYLKERIERKESVIFLAVDQKSCGDVKPLGFVQLYPTFSTLSMKRVWILNDLFVDPTARRNGIAKQLMLKAKAFVIDTGAKGLRVETATDNKKAQHLYESLGYQKDVRGFHYHYYF
ncbi:GNAT family N-acetyltransferase [Metabacillus dongyingensis]|nr:GNAT family N-acetyltransferase [Metabacillus dongyingensis]